jgi:translocation and assembly module TamB
MVIKKRAASAALALALAALAALVLMPRLNEATVAAVSDGFAAVRARLDGMLGLSVSFESLSPSILSSASFSKLSISAPGGRTLLSARKVRVLYNLVAILRGKGAEAITGLELADVTLDLHLPEDSALLSRLSSLFAGGGGGSIPRIVISGKNVAATVSLEGKGSASFVVRELGLSTLEEEPVVTLDGRFSLEPSGFGLGAITGPLSLSGSIARDFRKARLGLSVAADSRDFSLSTQRFELVYGDGELALTKVKDRAPLDAALRISFAGGESSASFKLDGYAPSRSLRVASRYASLMPWLDIPYRGTLNLKAPGLEFSKMSYEAALSGSLPARLLRGNASSFRAELAAHGDVDSASIEKARIERGSDYVEYAGTFRFRDLSPDGVLDLRLSLMGGALDVASSLHLVGEGGEYAVVADQATVGGAVFKDLALAVSRKGAQADFNLSFRPPDSAEPADEAALPEIPTPSFSGEAGASSGLPVIRCEGSTSFNATPNLEVSIDLETVDLGPLKNLLSVVTGSPEAGALLSSLKLGGSFFATSDFKRLSWSAPDLTIVSRKVAGSYALLSLSGTTTSVAIKKAVVSFSGYSIAGSGMADFSDPHRLGFEAKLALKDIPYALQGSVAGQDISITGDYGLAVSAHTVAGDSYLSLRSRALPIPLGGGLFLATVDADGRFSSLQDWALSVSDLTLVPAGEKMSAMPKIELAGNFGPRSANLPSLRLEDKYSVLAGQAAIAYSLSKPLSGRLTAKLAAIPSAPSPKAAYTPESYNLDLSYSGGSCEGFVDLVASPLARLGKLPIDGSADGRLSIRGDLSDPSLDFSLSLRDGRYKEQTLALAGSGSYGKSVLELRNLSAAYQGQAISGGSAIFSFPDAKAVLSLSYSGSFGGENLKFSLSAHGASTRTEKGGSLTERLASYQASGSLSGLSFGTVAVERWPFDASIDSASASFVGGSSGELRLKYAENGVLSASLRSPFPVRADVSGLYDGKNIDLSVQGLEFDLGLLSPLMPADLIKIAGGKARGGFRAIGLANDPEITGEIDLEGASVRVLGWVADDIGPFNAPIVALGRKVSVAVPSAPSGKASVALACQATFDHWAPAGLTASARTIGGTTLHLDSVILGIHAKGDATADVGFALQGDVLHIDADVALEKATVVVSTETLATGGEVPASRALWLAVTTNVRFGRGVQVYFPSTSFPIVAGYSDPSSSLAIRYDQSSSDFSLKGTVALRGGEVFYVQRNFFLKNGKIVFNEGSDRFDPRVTLLAELRDRNEEGPVVITLRADNAPIASFKPTLSSDPIMSEAQIAALMGQNVFGTSSDNSLDIRKTAISASEFIPQLNVTRALENKVRDVFGLDIFYLRTQVLQNWLIDISGQPATVTGNPLARYFDQTSIYAGKYLNDSIFAYGSMGVQESAPLVGTDASIINWELGLELDAPFGRLTWALAPEDWKNLKFRDQSLSLSWKLSY